MHIHYIGKADNAAAVHVGDVWALFSYQSLVAAHKDGDDIAYFVKPVSRTTRLHILEFMRFVAPVTPVEVSEQELLAMCPT